MPPKKSKKNLGMSLNQRDSPTEGEGEQRRQAEEVSDMESGSSQVSQAELLTLIRSIIREEIGAAFDRFQPQLDALKVELDTCGQKLGEMEEGLVGMDDRVAAVEAAHETLMKENNELKDKIEKMEIHSRKLNLRVFGLKSDIEKGNPTAFMTNFFKEVFRGELTCEPAVEIAHRVGPVHSVKPRPMIVRMQRYLAKEAILKLARNKREVLFQDMRVKIFPDITPEISRRRAQFSDIRMKLRKAEVRHGLLFPATLIVTYNGQTRLYKDCNEAETFYRKVIGSAVQAGTEINK